VLDQVLVKLSDLLGPRHVGFITLFKMMSFSFISIRKGEALRTVIYACNGNLALALRYVSLENRRTRKNLPPFKTIESSREAPFPCLLNDVKITDIAKSLIKPR
jgi:hypothetical protein